MSGGSVPYHLRQNKAVERGVFIDALMRIGRCTTVPLHQYRYVGFAGPFSEDFKLVHSQLGISKFISLENDDQVHARQRWNAPLKGIDYRQQNSGEFVDEYAAEAAAIIWLDYASPRQIEAQLNELQALVSKLADFDVVKVTFNASAATLGPESTAESNTSEQRAKRAKQKLGKFLPDGFEIDAVDVDKKGYPSLILKAAEFAIKGGMTGKPSSRFQLLTAFTYADAQHKMLTLTGIILPDKAVVSFLRDSGFSRWKLATRRWGDPRTTPLDISVPEMSLRERLFVDQQLPRRGSSKILMRRLGFQLGGQVEEDTLHALESYSTFYRYFPYFSKMIV